MAEGSQSFDDELVGLFDSSQDAFCIAGFDGYLKHANPAFPRTLGYTLEEMLAVPFVDNIYPGDRESVEAVLAELANGCPVAGFECRHVRADGVVRWLEWSTSSRPEAGVMYGVARDVTERRLAGDELGALRRVAMVAAEGVAPSNLFAVVAEEVARVMDVPVVTVVRYEPDAKATVCSTFPTDLAPLPAGTRFSLDGTTLSSLVRDSSAAVRVDDYSQLNGGTAAAVRDSGVRAAVGVPIVVAGSLWGSMAVWSMVPEPLPDDTAERLAHFTELLATAIANAESREALARLAEQQAALRRVATLVARGASPSDVFEAVADEMARWLRVMHATVSRFEAEAFIPLAIYHGDRLWKVPEGLRWPLEGDNVVARVFRSGGTARMDSHDDAPGLQAAYLRELGLRSAVGVPIIVDGRVWGAAIVASSASEPLPPDTEARIREFADLVATAIANAAARTELRASRDELRVLAEQQAALRRVATLVARGTPPMEVFSIVAEEMARCLNAANAGLGRFEGDEVVVLATAQFDPDIQGVPVAGERIALEGDNFLARVFRTGAAARVDGSESRNAPGPIATRVRELGLGCTVAVPIVVDERVWGAATVGAAESLPPDTEARMSDFADLVATAIANAATRSQLHVSQDELRTLAEQQSALRRVAILVAREVAPTEVFSAVATELAHCLGVQHAAVYRYESDDTATLLASARLLASRDEPGLRKTPIGTRFSFQGDNINAMVYRTGRTARMDSHQNAAGPTAAHLRKWGIRSAVGAPIIVGDCVWGATIVGTSEPEPLPSDTEARIGDFADIVSTAIANAATRSELIASRARIVAASDDARRRLERDLHDGAQQRLIALGLGLRAAEACVPDELQPLREQIAGLVTTVTAVSAEVQEISRGIHPAILSKGGLGPALKTLARRCTVPVDLDLHVDQRFADSVEVGAYYVVAEALTNAAKHARASVVEVCAHVTAGTLRLEIRDDGIGGAAAGKGSGLIGLVDRVEALGGKMTVQSPAGSGTSLIVDIPLDTI